MKYWCPKECRPQIIYIAKFCLWEIIISLDFMFKPWQSKKGCSISFFVDALLWSNLWRISLHCKHCFMLPFLLILNRYLSFFHYVRVKHENFVSCCLCFWSRIAICLFSHVRVKHERSNFLASKMNEDKKKVNVDCLILNLWINSRITELIQKRQRSPWLWPDIVYFLTPSGREHNHCLKILHGFTNKVRIPMRKNFLLSWKL